MPETPDYDKSAIPVVHAASHENGGSDEINVGGLAGLLTDEQLSSWAGVSGKPATFPPVAHAADHEFGGIDEIDVGGLMGLLSEEQFTRWALIGGIPATFPPDPHHGTHEAGGSDVVVLPSGMWEIDLWGALMPITAVGGIDQYWELDGAGGIMPKEP